VTVIPGDDGFVPLCETNPSSGLDPRRRRVSRAVDDEELSAASKAIAATE
jgi:hypothetical protein